MYRIAEFISYLTFARLSTKIHIITVNVGFIKSEQITELQGNVG